MMMVMIMIIMVDNSESLLDGLMQAKPSLYAANHHLEPGNDDDGDDDDIMVDNSETLLDGLMQTKPSLYAANHHLEPGNDDDGDDDDYYG